MAISSLPSSIESRCNLFVFAHPGNNGTFEITGYCHMFRGVAIHAIPPCRINGTGFSGDDFTRYGHASSLSHYSCLDVTVCVRRGQYFSHDSLGHGTRRKKRYIYRHRHTYPCNADPRLSAWRCAVPAATI